jgi:hypothetical protein
MLRSSMGVKMEYIESLIEDEIDEDNYALICKLPDWIK